MWRVFPWMLLVQERTGSGGLFSLVGINTEFWNCPGWHEGHVACLNLRGSHSGDLAECGVFCKLTTCIFSELLYRQETTVVLGPTCLKWTQLQLPYWWTGLFQMHLSLKKQIVDSSSDLGSDWCRISVWMVAILDSNWGTRLRDLIIIFFTHFCSKTETKIKRCALVQCDCLLIFT